MKYNRSKTYLLPLLSELVELDKKFMPYLVNTYMYDNENINQTASCKRTASSS